MWVIESVTGRILSVCHSKQQPGQFAAELQGQLLLEINTSEIGAPFQGWGQRSPNSVIIAINDYKRTRQARDFSAFNEQHHHPQS